VAEVVDQLLDDLVEKGPRADLVTDYALPLPCRASTGCRPWTTFPPSCSSTGKACV
jgi:hypothetical protein